MESGQAKNIDTIHFSYSLPVRRYIRLYNKFKKAIKLPSLTSLYKIDNRFIFNWAFPIKAPYSISYHLGKGLSDYSKVRVYDFLSGETAKLKDNDVFLGHPKPDYSQFPWQDIDKNSVTYKTISKYPYAKNFIIVPYNHDPKQMKWAIPFYERFNPKFIFLCGDFYLKTWEKSPLNNVIKKENVLSVNMAVDACSFPYLRDRFNRKGKRKFLYIGRTDYPKNIKMLERIAESFPGFEGGYISNGDIKGWKKISDFRVLEPSFMRQISSYYDIFLSTSEADAQATTVLEAMSMGFAVAATPESGTCYPSIIPLDVQNLGFNLEQLNLLQNMDEEVLKENSIKNRAIIESNHNWETITSSIYNFINK